MNILYIANSTSMSGGDNKSLLTLLRGVRENNVNPFVVLPTKDELFEVLSNEGFHVAVVNYRMDIYPFTHGLKNKILFLPRLFMRRVIELRAVNSLRSLCRQWDINLVHSNVSVLSCGFKAAMSEGLPHVSHVREYVDKDFGMRPHPSMRSYYQRLNHPGNYTISITRGLRSYHGLVGVNDVQIYNGISMDASDGHSEFFGEKYFFFAGRIEPAKGVGQLLEAYSAFISSHPDGCGLKLAGVESDSAYAQQLRQFVRDEGLESKVQFLGPRSDVGSLMRDAQATIVSSVFEAFGRCLPEAMLNECITIGRDIGGTKEQYDNGLRESGMEIGLRYTTTAELTQRMNEVEAADNANFADMKAVAKKVVQHLYSPETYIEQVCNFYKRITDNNRK